MQHPYINRFTDWYFTKKAAPYWIVIFLDLAIYYAVWAAVYAFFVGFSSLQTDFWPLMCTVTLFAVPLLVSFRIFRTYSGIVRFSSAVDLLRVIYSQLCTALVNIVLHKFTNANGYGIFAETRSVQIVVVAAFASAIMMFIRVAVKFLYDHSFCSDNAANALIYGTMQGGVGLAKGIQNEKPARFTVKGFITHDPLLKDAHLLGQPVYFDKEDIARAIKKFDIKAVLISPVRNEDFRHNIALQDLVIGLGCKIFMASNVGEWDPNSQEQPQLHEVNIEDLLPREQIQVDMDSIGALLRGKSILITGSAGSIGSEMVRQIAKYHPARLLLIDQAETPQHDVQVDMARDFPEVEAHVVVTSISHHTRMEKMFREFKPDYVFHAAAYKHVPMMEENPQEAVLNNVYGTKVIADLSVKYGVKKFVMISTDKAVNPTNVMGCSKRICEIYCQSLNKAVLENNIPETLRSPSGDAKPVTQFVTTRFGNVLGSNGSVIPLFEKQIKAGGPVTVTDPKIVRFFMLIAEACKLVLEAGTKGKGGEIFVFDMGEPVKIADLAQRMINLSGAKNVIIEYTGLREGEKLYEEVLSNTENTIPSFHEKIRIAKVREYDYKVACRQINELCEIAKTYDPMATVKKMKAIVTEYVSNNSIYEILDKH